MVDGNQLKWKVQYDIIYNNIYTEIVICNVNVQYAMLLQYLCGDDNTDLLKVKISKHYCNYFDNVVSNGIFPKITLLTRLSDHVSTLIDNIFPNNMDETGTSGILLNNISDH